MGGTDETQEDVTMARESDDEEGDLEEDGRRNGGKSTQKEDAEFDDEEDLLDDLDSGSGNENEDEEAEKEVENLEQAVAANPYDYEAHVKLISFSRKAGLLEKLRGAREAMRSLYPLTPDMWSQWTQDEARLVSRGEIGAVEALYERGIQDYLVGYESVKLWKEYLKFVEDQDASVAECSTEGVSKMRKLYERALAAVGLHFSEGGKVWEEYREFEQVLLGVLDAKGGEGRTKQIDTVRAVFQRQLTVPLASLPDTLQEYKDWEDQLGNHIGDDSNELAGLPSNVCLSYKKAVQLCSIRELHEEKIGRGKPGEAELFQHYLGYISIEEATGVPARAQVLYERAIAAFPVSQDIWMKYTQFLETNLQVSSVLKDVYARAVRNCPWVESLWKSYLLALERFHASEMEISTVFEQSLQGGFQIAQEFLDLFLTRCDGLRRRIMMMKEDPDRQSYIATLHDTFDRATQFLSTYFPDFVDRTLQLHAYWADMEAYIVLDLAAARGVWEGLIKSSGGMTEVWQAYISMEISLKNIKEARAIYRRCYSRRWEGHGTELMCSAWLRFEREHGSLEDYDRAVMKVAPRLAEVQSMQFQQEVKSAQSKFEPRSAQGTTEVKSKAREQLGRGEQGSAQDSRHDSASGKRKRGVGYKEPAKPELKRPRVAKEEEALQGETKVAITDLELEDTMGASKASVGPSAMGLAMVVKPDEDPQKMPVRPKSPRLYTDDCTAFISNLSFEVTEEQLREFFSSVAGVKEIRLLKDKFTGRPRGLAYVDFEDAESLAAAVLKDKEELAGRRLMVAQSAPKSGRGVGRSGAGGNRGGGRQARGYREASRGEGSGRGVRGVGALGHRRGGKVSMAGSNTFAVPRTVVRPLGWNPGQAAVGDEVPKSNDEFRKMLFTKK